MFYEMKPRETMDKLLEYAGNFTGDAYKKAVRVIRKSGREQQIYNVDDTDYAAFALDDGDEVTWTPCCSVLKTASRCAGLYIVPDCTS